MSCAYNEEVCAYNEEVCAYNDKVCAYKEEVCAYNIFIEHKAASAFHTFTFKRTW